MSTRPFCPIMTIGFNPPEEGKRDLRLCMKDCAWYDIADETCKINKIAEHLEYINAALEGVDSYGMFPSDAFEEERDFYRGLSEHP